jgi:hypothetical protein
VQKVCLQVPRLSKNKRPAVYIERSPTFEMADKIHRALQDPIGVVPSTKVVVASADGLYSPTVNSLGSMGHQVLPNIFRLNKNTS